MGFDLKLRNEAVAELAKLNPKYADPEVCSILWCDAVDLMCELIQLRATVEGMELMALLELD